MLIPTNGISRYNTVQPLLSPPFIFHKPFTQNDSLIRHHRASSYSYSSHQHQHRLKPLKLKNNESDDTEYTEYTTSIEERVSGLFTTPTPGIVPDLALGYPLLLTTAFLFLPIPSAALLLGFFAVFSLAGRKLILEDYLEEQNEETKLNNVVDEDDFWEKPPTDLLALGSSILCTALFAPDTGNNNELLRLDEFPSTGAILAMVAIISIFLVLGTNGEQTTETTSPQQQLMQLWDDQLAEQTDDETEERR
mmetsp:Transcript_29976/g.71983  ORF Transcript_29976/g.71983 Transcript_29976/m.71983 type:complete len:250 (+) Transcript_29976:40-789(+)